MIIGLCVVMMASPATKSSAGHATTEGQSVETPGYRITNSIDLSASAAAATARIELLEDQRLSPKIREELRGKDVAMFCAEPPRDSDAASLCASIKDRALRGAMVRLVDQKRTVLDQRTFARELAEISPARLYKPPRNVFAVTVDFGVGFGSYAGLTTYFVEPSGGRLHWLTSFGLAAAKPTEVALARTLKSDWHTVARVDHRGFDILAVRCQPDLHGPVQPDGVDLPFVIIYERYSFDGARWLRKERRDPGFWEDDQSFPSGEKFPL